VTNSLGSLRDALEAVADPNRSEPMAAYMRDQFAFLGVGSTDRRTAQRPFLADWAREAREDPQMLDDLAPALWGQTEREFQYVGVDLLRRVGSRLPPESLPMVRRCVQTKSWWDTVDGLAKVVGAMVTTNPGLRAQLDQWVLDPDIWVARTAILHQLSMKSHAEPDLVFSYCEAQIDHPDFFIRKAIGWALRDLARTYPDEVWDFVDTHPQLSGLSRREATKHRPCVGVGSRSGLSATGQGDGVRVPEHIQRR
jgi:3-methyladenine DNA glycosylase AlkD